MTHVNGDGDGWGSACALAYHFARPGVDVHLLAATPYPDRLRFVLPQHLEILEPGPRGFEVLRAADAQVVVDASEPSRLGAFADYLDLDRTVIIDHHAVAPNKIEAALLFIDPAAAAAAELVYDVLSQTGRDIGSEAATAIYVGIVTDTGSFRYSNSSPRVHRLAADLIERGVDPEALYRPLFGNVNSRELAAVEAALAGLQFDHDIGLAWSALGSQLEPLDEYELVIDQLRNLRGTEVVVLLRELPDGSVKVSFRSNGPTDVAAIAQKFGGGGHKKAAGANVDGPLEAVTRRIIEACREAVVRRPT